jgi:beta-glucanase (GH16 family)
MTRTLLAATLFAAFAALGQAAVPAGANGFSLVWSDDFTGGANTPPSSDWNYDTGNGVFGTGEIETMTNSIKNVYQDGNGNLRLVALGSGTSWTSGRIETSRDDFTAPAGGILAVEGRMQLPAVTGAAAAGYWPAFWMLGSTLRTGTAWPGCGEIDIMENINGINEVFGTLHCGTSPGKKRCHSFDRLEAYYSRHGLALANCSFFRW